MAPLFPSHGQYSIYRDGCILVTEVVGPWNFELVDEWSKAAIPFCIEMHESGPWVAVAIASQSMLATPDAMTALRKIVRISVAEFNCRAHVVVANREVDGRGVVEGVFEKAYEGLCASGFFDDYQSAKEWAIALLTQQTNRPT